MDRWLTKTRQRWAPRWASRPSGGSGQAPLSRRRGTLRAGLRWWRWFWPGRTGVWRCLRRSIPRECGGGGLLAGWGLDRYDRRRLLAGDSLVRAAVFATVPVAAALGELGVTQLYLVAAVYGLLKMISLAGFPALIPSLVPAEQLTAANAL